MALIGMAVYSTEENKKDDCLEKTLHSLSQTVDFSKHRLMVSVNASTARTKELLGKYYHIIDTIIYNNSNLGTAEALNKVIRQRDGQHVVKIDDDVLIHSKGWVDLMEEAISRDNQIGVIGLKRKDLIQTPWNDDPHFKSELKLLPHKAGEKWIVVERTDDIIGTCTMFNAALLDVIGYSRQPGKYGFEDNLTCHRAHLSGFYNCFLPHIEIDHIDEGEFNYISWKQKHSGEHFDEYKRIVLGMIEGKEPVYYNPFKEVA